MSINIVLQIIPCVAEVLSGIPPPICAQCLTPPSLPISASDMRQRRWPRAGRGEPIRPVAVASGLRRLFDPSCCLQ